jgi:hypothetical protein
MANSIRIKRSTTTATPSGLAQGELAYSESSDNLFIGTASSTLEKIGGNADVVKLATVETNADVTDTANVTSAGALMDSELAGLAAVKATTGTFLTADQTKLDGIASSANNYSLPTATSSVLGGVKNGTGISNSSGVLSVSTAYLADSHAASGVTSTKITNWDNSYDWYTLMDASNDSNNIVSTVAEMITLFDSTAETLDLMTALNDKMDDGQTIDGGTF